MSRSDDDHKRPPGDRATLSIKHRKPAHSPRTDQQVFDGLVRQIRAFSVRASSGDPVFVPMLKQLDQEMAEVWSSAVAGWRRTGSSDREIGEYLNVKKQSVQERWPRSRTVGGDHDD